MSNRYQLRRELDRQQGSSEDLDQFVMRKWEIYKKLHPSAEEDEIVQFVVDVLRPELRRLMIAQMPTSVEELILRGRRSDCSTDRPGSEKSTERREATGGELSKEKKNSDNSSQPLHCFVCKEKGHISYNCPNRVAKGEDGVTPNLLAQDASLVGPLAKDNLLTVPVEVAGRLWKAMLDTGATHTIVSAKVMNADPRAA